MMTAPHRVDDLVGRAGFGFVVEFEAAVDALVGAFLLLDGANADQAEGPPLRLMEIPLSQRAVWRPTVVSLTNDS